MDRIAGILALLCVAGIGMRVNAQEPKTIITGDEMRIMEGGKKIIFSGKSKVTRGTSELNADELVQDKGSNQVEASGKVSFHGLSRDQELVEGRSEKARYAPEKGTGELWDNRPEIVYHVKNATAPIVVNADRITFDEKKDELFASGAVEILTSSGSAYAPFAHFQQSEKKLVLNGTAPQPLLIYSGEQKGRYKADLITLYTERHKVILEGNVNGKVDMQELDKKR